MNEDKINVLFMALECILKCSLSYPLGNANDWEERNKYILSTIKCIEEIKQ